MTETYRVLTLSLPQPNSPVLLDAKEAKHVVKVLRCQSGDLIQAYLLEDSQAEQPQFVWVRLYFEKPSAVFLQWMDPLESKSLRKKAHEDPGAFQIEIVAAILKPNAMGPLIPKLCELSVHRLIPVVTQRTVVVANLNQQQRWQRIADQSLKQSGRTQRLRVEAPCSLKDFIFNLRFQKEYVTVLSFWCDEKLSLQEEVCRRHFLATKVASFEPKGFPLKVRVFLGPEGGFTPEEAQMLNKVATPVSLGPVILKADTAAIFATSVIWSHVWPLKSLEKS
jgi:RsmE family RNA methyltransferase